MAGGVCTSDGGKSGGEEVLTELGRATVTRLELKVRRSCQFPQVCWAPTVLRDVRTSHYVLFHELSVFLENQGTLNLATWGWPFLGNYTAVAPPGRVWVSSSNLGIWGKIILASRAGSSVRIDGTPCYKRLAGGGAC